MTDSSDVTTGAGTSTSGVGGSLVQTDRTIEPTGDGRGKTSIAETVVTKIANLAAREVDGVVDLGGTVTSAISSVVGRVRGSEHRTAGVGVEVGAKQAAVDLVIKVRYPFPIHEVADSVRQNVIDRIEGMTGLAVVEVNIAVTDLAFDSDEEPSGPPRVE
jgi:uncharacterized alkaline shock family protein YloU